MPIDDREVERLRVAFSALAERAAPTDQCPPADRLSDAARGALAPEQLGAIVDHVSTCPACAEAWQLAVDLAHESLDRIEPPAARAFASPRAWWIWTSLAAAAVVVAAVVVFPQLRAGWTRTPSTQDAYRTAPTDMVRSLLADGQPLPRNHVLLRWSPVGQGATYSVDVATEDLTTLDRAVNLTTNEYLVPERALATLAPGTKLIWQVQATLLDGRSIKSRSFMLSVQ